MSRRRAPSATIAVWAAVLAVSACTSAPTETVSPEDTITMARRLDMDGQHREAVALYREVLGQTPSSFDAHYGIARALDLAGQYGEAQQHFDRAIELAPEPARDQALRMMAISHTFARDVDAAATYFRQVLDRRVAAGDFAGAADVAHELGRVHLELGDPADALDWYRTGYDTAARQSDRSPAQIDLAEFRWAHAQARIAARRGEEAEARRHQRAAEAAIEKGSIADQQIHLPYLRGYVAYHLGDDGDAIEALRQADQDDPFILLLLGQALERSGQGEEARTFYRRVLASSSHAVASAIARPAAAEKLGHATR